MAKNQQRIPKSFGIRSSLIPRLRLNCPFFFFRFAIACFKSAVYRVTNVIKYQRKDMGYPISSAEKNNKFNGWIGEAKSRQSVARLKNTAFIWLGQLFSKSSYFLRPVFAQNESVFHRSKLFLTPLSSRPKDRRCCLNPSCEARNLKFEIRKGSCFGFEISNLSRGESAG